MKTRTMICCIILFAVLFSACAGTQKGEIETPQPEPTFQSGGSAFLMIPSLNGNQIAVRIRKPEGDGPFPVVIGVSGGDGFYAFQSDLPLRLQADGVITVDFAPQGRDVSEGEDNHHGYVHQDDLKAIVDYVSGLSFVDAENIGILSYSYGVVLASGALARYPEMPVAYFMDWEGPTSPGKDLQRGLENEEAWAQQVVLFLNNGREPTVEELSHLVIHGGEIYDDIYWNERDALQFAAQLPCPYLRVQFMQDHAQGTDKTHMISLVNAVTIESGQWTRVNDNPVNMIYTEQDLADAHFHEYEAGEASGLDPLNTESLNNVLYDYIEEMIFEQPYLD